MSTPKIGQIVAFVLSRSTSSISRNKCVLCGDLHGKFPVLFGLSNQSSEITQITRISSFCEASHSMSKLN